MTIGFLPIALNINTHNWHYVNNYPFAPRPKVNCCPTSYGDDKIRGVRTVAMAGIARTSREPITQ
jgi:hypothetical protein